MRVLVLSDIHGNIDALEAVLAAEPTVDRVLCLGDTVDYGPAPDATLRWVRKNAQDVIRGNHDNAMGLGEDCRSAGQFHRLSVETRRRTTPFLTEDERAYLGGLPLRQRVDLDGKRMELVHATPGDPLFRYLPPSSEDEWRREAIGVDADLLLVGHTHLPAIVDLGGVYLLNPGSVGLPRSGDPRASYAVIVDGVPELRKAPYDSNKAVRRLWQVGFPHDVARSIESIYLEGELRVPPVSGLQS
jgi:predicted phosphodiesterase